MNELKEEFWKNKTVIFHSRDIRKCEKDFSILFDLGIKARFYQKLNKCVADGAFTIITSSINKEEYIKKFGRLSNNNVYELCLSYVIERAVYCLDGRKEDPKKLDIVIERRGTKEDKTLQEHFQRLLSRGTGFIAADRLKAYDLTINFKSKKENINGLQLSDLIAYPCANYVKDPLRANPAFDVFKEKIYQNNGKIHGLKVYP